MNQASLFPLSLDESGAFGCVRQFLQESGYEPGGLCGLLKIADLSVLGSAKLQQIDWRAVSDRLGLLTKLFLLLQAVPERDLHEGIAPRELEALKHLGLVTRVPGEETAWYSPAFLYPVHGFFIASDRHCAPDGTAIQAPTDVVFPAIFPGTLRFLRLFSTRPVSEALDLCAGTGIGALLMSQQVKRAVSADLTERASQFAKFNCRLNECRNVEVLRGDLYEAVGDRQFDRIVAHPPYVPSLGDNMVFRDGGRTGETVLRELVKGLPDHLRANGTFCALCLGLDSAEGKLEQRVRSWLGPAQSEFDVLFAWGDEKTPQQAVHDIGQRSDPVDPGQSQRILRAYRDEGAEKVVYGALFLRRRSRPGEVWTVRPRLSQQTDGACLDWWLDWQEHRSRPDFLSNLAGARPRLASRLLVKNTYGVRDGALAPAEFILESDKPFKSATRFDPWVIPMISRFDSQHTVAEVHQLAQAAEEIPSNFQLTDLQELVALVVERGYLELDACPLP